MVRDSTVYETRRIAVSLLSGLLVVSVVVGFVTLTSEPTSAQTSIDSCTTIDRPGDYVLTEDLESTGTCITIANSRVNFDGQGHTIENTGNEKSGNGIRVISLSGGVTTRLNDVDVRNVTVTGFSNGILVQLADNVRITGVEATNNEVGIKSDSEQAVISGNTASDNEDTGIISRKASEISENTVRSNGVRGIYVQYPSISTEVHSNTVTDHRGTYVGGPSPGIVLRNTQARRVEGNTLDNNGFGILLIQVRNTPIRGNHNSEEARPNDFAIRLETSSGNTVAGNTFERDFLAHKNSERNVIRRNEVREITISDSERNTVFDNEVSQIRITDSPRTSVLGNTVTGTESLGVRNGVVVTRSGGTEIRGNEIFENGDGILIGESPGTKIQFNDIRANANGVRIHGEFARRLTIRGNNFVGNSQYGIKNEVPEYVSARHNYWGAPNGPSSPEDPDTPFADALTGELADGDGDAVSEWPDRPGISNVGFDGWSREPNPVITREPPEIGPENPPIDR